MAKDPSVEINVCADSDEEDTADCGTVCVPQGVKTCSSAPVCGSPEPYYKRGSVCPEDNKQTIIVERISQILSNKTQFCVPKCGDRAFMTVDGITGVVNGSWLWNPEVGYLRISDFDVERQQITLENICSDVCEGQAIPGSIVPACSTFIATAPLCSALLNPGFGGVFLNSGFVAPESGECVQIAVTSVEGLYVSKLVIIQTGTYRITSVDSESLITICNDGNGITPGTTVDYRDSSGNLTTPLVSIDSNPCLEDATTHGKILVCDGNVQRPFIGTITGQIPIYDSATGEWSPATVAVPTLLCTDLTVGLTLDPVNNPAFSYLVQVSNTGGFTVGDIVTIGADSFTIDTIDTLTTLHATPLSDPAVITNYSVGASLCQADCCTILDSRMDTVESKLGEQLQSLSSWVPAVSINGTGSISNLALVQTDFSRNGAWIPFKLSITFDIAGAGPGSGSTAILVSAPTVGGRNENTAVYSAHGDEAGAIVPNGLLWRHVTPGADNSHEFQFYKPGILEWANGAARIDLDGKYAVAP